jgi:hypothetical protein
LEFFAPEPGSARFELLWITIEEQDQGDGGDGRHCGESGYGPHIFSAISLPTRRSISFQSNSTSNKSENRARNPASLRTRHSISRVGWALAHLQSRSVFAADSGRWDMQGKQVIL